MRREINSDGGLSIVEVLIAIAIVTTGLLALLGEMATYVHQHSYQKARTTAVRLATTELEDARRRPVKYLKTLAGTSTTSVAGNGVSYTKTTTVEICKVGSGAACTNPAAGEDAVARVQVSVAWTDSHGDHHVTLRSTDADTDPTKLPGSTNGLVTDTTGASGSGVTVTSMSVSPTAVAVNGSGHPVSTVTVTLLAVGLASDTTIPVTWTDDNGSHQASMTGNGATWSVDVPGSSITRSVASGSASVVFAATVPGVHTLPTTTLTVLPQPTFSGNCSVTPAPITLVPLTRKTALPEVVTCTTTGLVATDTVRATYASGSGSANLTLVSVNGSSWTGTIASGTTMASSGSSESFTFNLARASDGATAASNLTVTLS